MSMRDMSCSCGQLLQQVQVRRGVCREIATVPETWRKNIPVEEIFWATDWHGAYMAAAPEREAGYGTGPSQHDVFTLDGKLLYAGVHLERVPAH